MSDRIAILVLACASPPYDVMIATIRNTWGGLSVPGVDIYYLYGNPEDEHARSVTRKIACCEKGSWLLDTWHLVATTATSTQSAPPAMSTNIN